MAWEYKTVKLALEGSFLSGKLVDSSKIETDLNALGAEGWELVSAFPTAEGSGVSREVVMILKRPR